MKLIAIDGNIGSGKSTFIKYIKENYRNIIFLPEPVNEWFKVIDSNGKNILENFYEDQKKYAFVFQINAFQSRLQIALDAIRDNHDAIIITERSLYTDRYVFAQMMHDEGNISTLEFNTYLNMYNYFIEQCKPDLMIYLDTTPSICHERVIKRGRKGENIPITYLQDCDKYHMNLIRDTPCKKIHVDSNNDISDRTYGIWDNVLIGQLQLEKNKY
jgi:deoxyadenosine/deoxycytidine kinase